MELAFGRSEISFDDKEMTILDKLVVAFISRLSNTKYVIVSGYTAILFGRSRNTEDVDIFIEKVGYAGFAKLYDAIASGGFYCINAEDAKEAYEILTEKSSIRFAETGTQEPNFEMKFPQNELNVYSLEHPVKVTLNGRHHINIGPMELQLAYKLYLGSEKDYLDASHLYEVFKGHIDKKVLKSFIVKLKIRESVVGGILGERL